MKTSPGARSWIAAGVRHELLIRSLPALRHHMVGPVSVIRMALMLLDKQTQRHETEGVRGRIETVETQLSALATAIKSLRDWELSAPGDAVTRSALVAQCVGLFQTPFALAGIQLEVDPRLQSGANEEVALSEAAAQRYLLIGALCHLHDLYPMAETIRIDAQGAHSLVMSARGRRTDAAPQSPEPPDNGTDTPQALRAPRNLAIDVVALTTLADDLRYPLTIERDVVRLSLQP